MSLGVEVVLSLITAALGLNSVTSSVVSAFNALIKEQREKGTASVAEAEVRYETQISVQKEADLATDAGLQVLDSAFSSTIEVRDERMRQAKLAFNAALTLVILGVLITFLGVLMLWFGSSIEAGSVTIGVGAITEIASLLLFKFNKEANRGLDEVRKELSAIETARVALDMAHKISDLEKRDEAIARLSDKLASDGQ